MARRRKSKRPDAIPDVVDAIVDDERVVWFPIKHFSPACAHHLGELIREIQPAGVMVEGPQDATSLIPFIVHDDTEPPFTLFSFYLDKRNKFELNGVLSASEEIPARFRGWWPFTSYSPEYVALVAGAEVGAELSFIDVPLHVTIPHHHVRQHETEQVVSDRHLAENAYFDALRVRQRRRSFSEFWNANFEVAGLKADRRQFLRAVLTFAECARRSGGDEEAQRIALEADGTLVREAHMRFCVDSWLKKHEPEDKLVVVTGAFHTVALPWTKRKKAKTRTDRYLETLLTTHSFRALANLYALNRLPGYQQLVWDELGKGNEEPFNAAGLQTLLEVMRRARDLGEGVSTADAVGAYKVARNLATLRRNREITCEDIEDAATMAYVKGDMRLRGGIITRLTRETLIGHKLGRVTLEAGQPPLYKDYYTSAKTHRLDVTGLSKTVRCDIHKSEKHRAKSAFLHISDFVDLPMFNTLDSGRGRYSSSVSKGHYKGPDMVTGENMHLITETWGIKWTEAVDDRLIELSDRGASLAQAAESLVRDKLIDAEGNAAETTRLLLRSAQMMLLDLFDELLVAVEDAIAVDSSFLNLAGALHDFAILHSYRDTSATHGRERLLETIEKLFVRSCICLPSIAGTEPEQTSQTLAAVQTVVRIAITFDGCDLDQQLLTEKLLETVCRPEGNPTIRGAGYGVAYSLGATRERVIARELTGYLLGSPEQVLDAGPFLEGLFATAKNIVLGSPRLLRAINEVLSALDWDTFKRLLPDLRRAFTQFIPSEIDDLSQRVSWEIGLEEQHRADGPIPRPLTIACVDVDTRIRQALDAFLSPVEAS